MTSTTPKTAALWLTLAAALSAGSALAQTVTGPVVGAPPTTATVPQGSRTLQAMFAWADQDKNGQLSRDEARAHLPITYSNFADIDTAKRGWISFEQFANSTNKRVSQQADEVLHIGQWH